MTRRLHILIAVGAGLPILASHLPGHGTWRASVDSSGVEANSFSGNAVLYTYTIASRTREA